MDPAPQRILVVSDDDLCAAPLIASVLRAEIGGRTDIEVDVASAGTAAETGGPACSLAASRIGDQDAISSHRSRPINGELVRRADLVLVLTVRQRRYVNRLVPGQQRSVFTLREAVSLALRDGAGAWTGDESVAEFAEVLHRRRGLVKPRMLVVPRRGLLRRPVAVIEVDDLLDGHELDRVTHRWAIAQAHDAATRLGSALRGRRGAALEAA